MQSCPVNRESVSLTRNLPRLAIAALGSLCLHLFLLHSWPLLPPAVAQGTASQSRINFYLIAPAQSTNLGDPLQPAKSEPAKSEPTKTESAKPQAVKPLIIKPEPMKTESAKTQAVKPQTIKPESIKPQAIQSDSINSESSDWSSGRVAQDLDANQPSASAQHRAENAPAQLLTDDQEAMLPLQPRAQDLVGPAVNGDVSGPLPNQGIVTQPGLPVSTVTGSVTANATSAAVEQTVPSSPADYMTARFAGKTPKAIRPALAKKRRLVGEVIVRGLLLADGRLTELSVYQSSGYPVLDEAAVAQAQAWQYQPARVDGRKVSHWVQIPVNFR